MTRTLSGHPVLMRGDHELITYPVAGGRRITTAGWARRLFVDFLEQWQTDRALGGGRLDLTPGPLDSYNYRKPNAGAGVSDHAGYAVDVRYDVLKADNREHMTPTETRAVLRILARSEGLLSWGGPRSDANPNGYRRLVDEMHVFVSPGVTAADVARWHPPVAAIPVPTPTPVPPAQPEPGAPYDERPASMLLEHVNPANGATVSYQLLIGTTLVSLTTAEALTFTGSRVKVGTSWPAVVAATSKP